MHYVDVYIYIYTYTYVYIYIYIYIHMLDHPMKLGSFASLAKRPASKHLEPLSPKPTKHTHPPNPSIWYSEHSPSPCVFSSGGQHVERNLYVMCFRGCIRLLSLPIPWDACIGNLAHLRKAQSHTIEADRGSRQGAFWQKSRTPEPVPYAPLRPIQELRIFI